MVNMEKDWDTSNDEKRYDNWLNSLLEKRQLTKKQRETLRNFNDFQKVRGIATPSRVTYVYEVLRFAEFIKKEFNEVTKEDLVRYFSSFDNLSKPTKFKSRTAIKIFYKWFYGMHEKGQYPPLVDWIKTRFKMDSNDFRGKSELPTSEEQQNLLHACGNNLRDKAMLMIFLERGIRPRTMRLLNLGDLEETEFGIRIYCIGKGEKKARLTLFDSAIDVKKWLNIHEFRSQKNAPLFYSLSKNSYGSRLTTAGIWAIIHRLKEKSGIKKNVFTYILRHTALTRMGKTHTNAELEYAAMWVGGSSMSRRYVHLDEDDVEIKEMEQRGLRKPSETDEENIIRPKKCLNPLCQELNEPGLMYCKKCYYPLTSEAALKIEEKRKLLEEKLEKVYPILKMLEENPNMVDQLKKFYQNSKRTEV
jgi:site-specific recombinase XerD